MDFEVLLGFDKGYLSCDSTQNSPSTSTDSPSFSIDGDRSTKYVPAILDFEVLLTEDKVKETFPDGDSTQNSPSTSSDSQSFSIEGETSKEYVPAILDFEVLLSEDNVEETFPNSDSIRSCPSKGSDSQSFSNAGETSREYVPAILDFEVLLSEDKFKEAYPSSGSTQNDPSTGSDSQSLPILLEGILHRFMQGNPTPSESEEIRHLEQEEVAGSIESEGKIVTDNIASIQHLEALTEKLSQALSSSTSTGPISIDFEKTPQRTTPQKSQTGQNANPDSTDPTQQSKLSQDLSPSISASIEFEKTPSVRERTTPRNNQTVQDGNPDPTDATQRSKLSQDLLSSTSIGPIEFEKPQSERQRATAQKTQTIQDANPDSTDATQQSKLPQDLSSSISTSIEFEKPRSERQRTTAQKNRTVSADTAFPEKENKTAQCGVCGEMLQVTVEKLNDHLCLESKCKFCGHKFKTFSDFVHHSEMNHSQEIKFECPYCGLFLSSKSGFFSLKTHINSKECPKGYYYKCSKCEETIVFKSQQDFKEHDSQYHFSGYQCSLCRKIFTLMESLKDHGINEHGTDKILKCPYCRRDFKRVGGVIGHVQMHKEETSKLLKEGILQKKYPCSKCEKEFASELFLKDHGNKNHGTEKVFRCPECDMEFTSSKNVEVHRKRKHVKEKRRSERKIHIACKCKSCSDKYEAHKNSKTIDVIYSSTPCIDIR